ncbi:MAG: phosphatase PAP2 family protein [Thermomicrobiales bacterium]
MVGAGGEAESPSHRHMKISKRAVPPPPSAGADAAPTVCGYAYVLGAIVGLYVLLATIFYFWKGALFAPDLPDAWALLLLVGAVALGRWKSFLVDWIPLVSLIFGYEMLRGFAGTVVVGPWMLPAHPGAVHFHPLITADEWLFGGVVPTIRLQNLLYDPGVTHWWDVLAGLMYSLHFALPLAFGFLIWTRDRRLFRWFVLTLLLMTYSTFIIYLVVPTAPPWLVTSWGYLPGIHDPFNQLGTPGIESSSTFATLTVWTKASPNPVAAFPSLHAAYPWLVMLFATRIFGRRGLLFLGYNALVWFAIIYLAQHWAIDALAGMAWATAALALVELAMRRWPSVFARLGIGVPRMGVGDRGPGIGNQRREPAIDVTSP